MMLIMTLCVPAVVIMMVLTSITFFSKKTKSFQHGMPSVAILLAVRDEEKNILDCLKSLEQLSYSKHHLQIFIGDDNSKDSTSKLIKNYIEDKPHFHYHLITDKKYGLKAKANVLEQLSEKTQAEYLFFTDADIEVSKHWIQNMLKHFDEDTGVVTGVTSIKGKSSLARLQDIDWLFALGLAHKLSEMKVPVTCMGNNMAVKKEAFDEVGGYKKIGFSVTEDFKLFRALLSKGWRFKNLYSKGVLAYSKPMDSFNDLLKQRKRWMKGGLDYSFFKMIPLLFFPLFYAGVAVSLFDDYKLSLGFLGVMMLLKVIVGINCFSKIDKRKLVLLMPIYELYSFWIMLLMVFYFPFSSKVSWKGRKL